MKKKLVPLVTVAALLAMPVSQAWAAPKPTPQAGNGQMDMSLTQQSQSQPQMSGWDMVKMRTTAKMRAKAARNAKLKGKPAQAVANVSMADVEKFGPDYFGTTPNYASSPLPHITWTVSGLSNEGVKNPKADPTSANYDPTAPLYLVDPTSHAAGDDVTLPVFDPSTGTMTDPSNSDALVTVAESPYRANPTNANLPVLDAVNQMPQLDTDKVAVSKGIRKFIEPLPGVGAADPATTIVNQDATGAASTPAYLPVGTPDTTTYPGSDYYEIGLADYYQQFSPDLPPTKLRGYYQENDPTGAAARPFYLGFMIKATKGRPVRVKFTNHLPAGKGGDLFVPVDTTAMGAGNGPDGTPYSTNRAVLHLHGGLTPWISDGTPSQWTVPKGAVENYPKGVSATDVPDMPGTTDKLVRSTTDPTKYGESTDVTKASDGSQTYFYTNDQSARLLWYHDHSYGLTRVNVYAGEAAPYVIDANSNAQDTDPAAANYDPASVAQTKFEALLPPAANTLPLIIQDKGFVPDDTKSGYFPDGQLTDQDPTWKVLAAKHGWGGTGQLWFPHVYMPNQNPYDNSGANAMGRWDYGPWFWPIFGTSAGLVHGEIANPWADASRPWEPPFIPGTPSSYTFPKDAASDVSLAPESFVDTPLVNGVAYPYLNVKPQAYRFKILNAANDRYWNLSMWCSAKDYADAWVNTDGTLKAGAPATAQFAAPYATAGTMFTQTVGGGLPTAAGEVPMVPAVRTAGFPGDWPTDGRDGGVPDYNASAGSMVQIGNESGVLPQMVDLRNGPVGYNYNRRDIVVLNVQERALFLGPAERADVVFDFSKVPTWCHNVVLYNDSPTPVPAFDPRNDYYTNAPDQTDSGGNPSTLPGYGPDTRTIMQFRIDANGTPQAWDEATAKAAQPATFATAQNKPLIPNTWFGPAYPDANDPIGQSDVYARIQSTDLTFNTTTVGDVKSLNIVNAGSGYAPTATVNATPTGTGATAARLNVTVGTVAPNVGKVTAITVAGGGGGGRGYARNVSNTGTNCSLTVSVSVPAATGSVGATGCAATNNQGAITGVRVANGGSNYTVAGAGVTIDKPTRGQQATATATVNPATGTVTALTLVNVGNGYTAAPNVTITPPAYSGGVQATATATVASASATVTLPADPKAIQELFEMDYGRMNATLGVELPFTNSQNQTTLPMGYAEPTTEFAKPSDGAVQIGTAKDGTTIWKVTHNGVDTHVIHFHLFDVQLINRVGWDGAVRAPEPNEMGWKESVKMNPLEDAIVAMRPATPQLPFKIGDSVRPIDPTMPTNHQMSSLDPATGQAITFDNTPTNMGWEYVWHCHLLGHEENDFMREVNFAGSPAAASNLAGSINNGSKLVTLTWRNNANWQLTNWVIERTSAFTGTGANKVPNWSQAVKTQSLNKPALTGGSYQPWQGANATLAAVPGNVLTWSDDLSAQPAGQYWYRLRAESANGYSDWARAGGRNGGQYVSVNR